VARAVNKIVRRGSGSGLWSVICRERLLISELVVESRASLLFNRSHNIEDSNKFGTMHHSKISYCSQFIAGLYH